MTKKTPSAANAPVIDGEIVMSDSNDPADAPLPIPDELIPEPIRHKIYVAFRVGGRDGSFVMQAPFEDIDSEEALTAVVGYIQQKVAAGKDVTIVNHIPLRG